MSETMLVSEIKVRSPFKDLFVINKMVLGAIEGDMRQYGYDESAPITLWKEGNVVIDGHTRLQAAKNIGLKEVHVCVGDFDEQTAVEYAIHNQRDRRNLTDAEILRRVEMVDKKMPVGRHKKDEKNDLNSKNIIEGIDNIESVKNGLSIPSHEKTAMMVGIEPSKVSKVRTILDSKNEKIKQEVLQGTKSIHAASEEIQKEKLKDRPMAAQINIACRKLEKDMKRVVINAIVSGVPIPQIKQVVRELLLQSLED